MDSGTTESFGREWDTPDEPDIDMADIPDIDSTKPHTARIYDYGLAGLPHLQLSGRRVIGLGRTYKTRYNRRVVL